MADPQVTVDWVFLCEDIELGPDDQVTSMLRIIKAEYGLGRRPLPLVLRPFFVLSLRSRPPSTVRLTVRVGDAGSPPNVREHPVPASEGGTEIAVPVGKFTLKGPGVLGFELLVNGESWFSIKAPLERLV